MMPKHRYWRADVKPYAYDIDKAKSLMAASSVPKGFSANVVVPSGDTIVAQVAQMIKQSWAQIGVNVTIQNLDAGTAATNWVERRLHDRHQLVRHERCDGARRAGGHRVRLLRAGRVPLGFRELQEP